MTERGGYEEILGGASRSCKRMADVGFDGLAAEADGDLRAAWRARLAREGKLNPGAGSVRELVLRPDSPDHADE